MGISSGRESEAMVPESNRGVSLEAARAGPAGSALRFRARRDDPPKIALVSIAGSAGGITAMREILLRLPADFPAPILYLQHLAASGPNSLPEVLQWYSALKVRWAQEGERLRAGIVYLCPAGHSSSIHPDGTVTLVRMRAPRDALHGADRLFASVAASYGQRAVAIVLSGAAEDGAEGVCAVQARRGTVIVQDEASANQQSMPRAALATGCVDLALRPPEIAPALVNLVRDGHPVAALRASAAALFDGARPPVGPSLQNALGRILGMTLTMHHTDLGNIQLVDQQQDALAIAAQRGFGLDFLEHFRTVGLADLSACGRAMRAREPVCIDDIQLDRAFAAHREVAEASGFRAVQSTPLISRGGSLLGVLSTHFRNPRRLLEWEIGWLRRHAQRAADGIERLTLTES